MCNKYSISFNCSNVIAPQLQIPTNKLHSTDMIKIKYALFSYSNTCFPFWSGVEPSPPLLRPLLAYCTSPPDDDECGAVGGMLGRGNRNTRRKSASVLLCTPKIPHDLIRTWTRVTTLGSQRLTSWAMAQPILTLTYTNVDYSTAMKDLL
jgi:hypothetical protein